MTLRFHNEWHDTDGRFAPRVGLAVTAPNPPVLVGVHVKDSELPMAGEGLPYMGDVPFLALYEVKLKPDQTPQQVASALKAIDFGEVTSKFGEAYSASNPLRRAVQVDPAPFRKIYDDIGVTLTDAGFKAGEYPLVVQLGTIDKAAARGLRGQDATFAGLITVTADGSIAEAETAPEAPTEGAVPPEEPVVEMAADVEIEIDDTTMIDDQTPGRWEGCLAVEGVQSGDGRVIALEALTWRDLPLPLMIMTRNPMGGEGHDGAELAGRIEWLERRDGSQPDLQEVWGGGVLDLGSPAGTEAARLLTPDEMGMAFLRGVSVDLDDVSLDLSESPDPLDALLTGGTLRVEKARVMGATLTPFPAFQEAQVVLVNDALVAAAGGAEDFFADALAASCGPAMPGAQLRVFTPYVGNETIVASAGARSGIPVKPPRDWFDRQEFDRAFPLRVDSNGRITGYAAEGGACHIGFGNRCVEPPESPSDYSYFMTKEVECDDGTMINTGVIIMDTVHPSLKVQASDTESFYAHTGCGIADVRVYRDQHGIQVAGAIRPSVTPEQLRAFRGSDVSPDWRPVQDSSGRTRTEFIGLLAVNTSGFITPALVASISAAGDDDFIRPGQVAARVNTIDGDIEVVALVAAGMMRHTPVKTDSEQVAELRADLMELRSAVAPILSAYEADRTARYAAVRDRLGIQTRDERRAAALDKLGLARSRHPSGRASNRDFVLAAARKKFGPSRRARLRLAVDRLVEAGVSPDAFVVPIAVVEEAPPVEVVEDDVDTEVTIEVIIDEIRTLGASPGAEAMLAVADALEAQGEAGLGEAGAAIEGFVAELPPEDEAGIAAAAILDDIARLTEDDVVSDEGIMEAGPPPLAGA